MPQFQFQSISHCFGNKIPIVIDPFRADIEIIFFKKWNSSWWLMVSSKRKVSGELKYHRGQVLKWGAVPSLPRPGLPGPLAASGVPSPWAAEKCARFWGQIPRGAWSRPGAACLAAGRALQQSFSERKTVLSILHALAKKCKRGVFIQNHAESFGIL